MNEVGEVTAQHSEDGEDGSDWTLSHLEMIRRGVDSDRGIAAILGVSASQVSRWRQGQHPDRENADRLAGLALVVEMLMRWVEPDIHP